MSALSLRNRLLFAATFILVTFIGLAGLALDRAFVSPAREAIRNQLRADVYTLLQVFDFAEDGSPVIPDVMPERLSRLNRLNSQLYAFILDSRGEILWRSKSSAGINPGELQVIASGQENFAQVGEGFHYSYGVEWETGRGRHIDLTWLMVNQSSWYRDTIQLYRKELFLWLGMATMILLVMQAVILRWGLKPLGAVTRELERIQQAKQDKILGSYPREIAQLSHRINSFIENERLNLTRYRDTLGDLAHSLKTPLAMIKGITDNKLQTELKSIDEMVERMNRIVEYQLNRAASSQLSVIHRAVDCEEVMRKLSASMKKVYGHKNIDSAWEIEPGAVFLGDESDLYEFLGNIMDNSFKWARSRALFVCKAERIPGREDKGLIIEIHDDGPGIAEAERTAVLERGVRADQQTPGQGIGLAVVREIVQRYRGELTIESSELGGALIRTRFPATAQDILPDST